MLENIICIEVIHTIFAAYERHVGVELHLEILIQECDGAVTNHVLPELGQIGVRDQLLHCTLDHLRLIFATPHNFDRWFDGLMDVSSRLVNSPDVSAVIIQVIL